MSLSLPEKGIIWALLCMSVLVFMQIDAEFTRIVSKNLKQSFFHGLDELVPRFLRLYRHRETVKELPAFLASLDADVSKQNIWQGGNFGFVMCCIFEKPS